jgi:hypothetical protein
LDTDSDRFKRAVLSLPDVRLRIDWLDQHVQHQPADNVAALLDVVIGESEISEPKAREVLVTIALWVAGSAREAALDGLRQAALQQRLLSLQRVIRRVPTPSQPPSPSETPHPRLRGRPRAHPRRTA